MTPNDAEVKRLRTVLQGLINAGRQLQLEPSNISTTWSWLEKRLIEAKIVLFSPPTPSTEPKKSIGPRCQECLKEMPIGSVTSICGECWIKIPRTIEMEQCLLCGCKRGVCLHTNQQVKASTEPGEWKPGELRLANVERLKEWNPGNKTSHSYCGNELAGEVGEACNILKKLDREAMGMVGSRATIQDLADELADVIICADLAALNAGIDLFGKAVPEKLNKTSEKYGLKTKMKPEVQALLRGSGKGEVEREEENVGLLETAMVIISNGTDSRDVSNFAKEVLKKYREVQVDATKSKEL